jgi:hypothetical protein
MLRLCLLVTLPVTLPLLSLRSLALTHNSIPSFTPLPSTTTTKHSRARNAAAI